MTSSATRDAFALLGLTPGATKTEIRAAWRALVRAYHPDQAKGCKAEANRRLTEINVAFELVSAWEPGAAHPQGTRPDAKRKTERRTPDARAGQDDQAAKRRAHASARRRADATARQNAERMARDEAARRAKRNARETLAQESSAAALARRRFVDALRSLDDAVAPQMLRFA